LDNLLLEHHWRCRCVDTVGECRHGGPREPWESASNRLSVVPVAVSVTSIRRDRCARPRPALHYGWSPSVCAQSTSTPWQRVGAICPLRDRTPDRRTSDEIRRRSRLCFAEGASQLRYLLAQQVPGVAKVTVCRTRSEFGRRFCRGVSTVFERQRRRDWWQNCTRMESGNSQIRGYIDDIYSTCVLR